MSSCTVCQDLNVYSLELTIEGVTEAKAACAACKLIYDGISHFVEFEEISKLKLLVDYALYVELVGYKGAIKFIEFSTTGSPSIWPRIGPARDISVDSSSDQCLNLAKSWLEKCLTKHPECSQNEADPPLPTRVVYVGDSNSEIRLFVTHGQPGKYATLSHCWGEKPTTSLTTTDSTLEERQISITLDDGSKTFRHAVEVTRKLGLKYLWIDSLCILQGSTSDWTYEAARMSSVYSNGVVNLMADSATRTSDGLFPIPDERAVLNPVLKLSCPGPDGPTMIRVRPRCDGPSNLEIFTHSSSTLPKSKLSTRGWVLQESRMSPRALVFSKEEMYWMCSTLSRCECRIRPGQSSSSVFRKRPLSDTAKKQNKMDLWNEWPLMVMEFTRRDLSFASDRLPALAGLAQWKAGQGKDYYLCGLWASDLRFQLAWYIEDPESTKRLDESAPTWSWASVDGSISYYGRWVTQFGQRYPGYSSHKFDTGEFEATSSNKSPPLEIVHFESNPSTNNQFGPARNAVLEVVGYLLPVKYDPNDGFWKPSATELEYLQPKDFRFRYDVGSEIPGIKEAGSTTDDFFFLYIGDVSSGVMTVVGHSVTCLLLQHEGGDRLAFRRRAMVERAGDGESWRARASMHHMYLL